MYKTWNISAMTARRGYSIAKKKMNPPYLTDAWVSILIERKILRTAARTVCLPSGNPDLLCSFLWWASSERRVVHVGHVVGVQRRVRTWLAEEEPELH